MFHLILSYNRVEYKNYHIDGKHRTSVSSFRYLLSETDGNTSGRFSLADIRCTLLERLICETENEMQNINVQT